MFIYSHKRKDQRDSDITDLSPELFRMVKVRAVNDQNSTITDNIVTDSLSTFSYRNLVDIDFSST